MVRDRFRSLALVAGAVVALVVVVLVAGIASKPNDASIATDRLGPDQGEPVDAYLERARATLGETGEPRYALVSFATELTPEAAVQVAGNVRISQVLHRVPIARVQTRLVVIDVPDSSAAVLESAKSAASQLLSTPARDDRGTRVDRVSGARLAQGCACVVGLTVRGTTQQLTELAQRNDVRAVEALPADAVFGRFAVVPLLPEQTDVVGPGPDDGEIPPA